MRAVYLDNNATTPSPRKSSTAMLPFLASDFGNPSQMHDFGGDSGPRSSEARERLARAARRRASAKRSSSLPAARRADNTAILGALEAADERGEIIASRVEHPAVLALCHASRTHAPHQGSPHRRRRPRPARSSSAIARRCRARRNGLGDVGQQRDRRRSSRSRSCAEGAKARRAVPHRRRPGGRASCRIDHEADRNRHALAVRPQAACAQGRRRAVRPARRAIPPADAGRQPGTRPARRHREYAGRLSVWARRPKSRLSPALAASGPGCAPCATGWRRPAAANPKARSSTAPRAPAAQHVDHLRGRRGGGDLLLLNRVGVGASSGSACSAGSPEPSHVVRAMGVPAAVATGATRFSLSRDNDDDDINRVIETMPAIVERLRARSHAPETAVASRSAELAYA